jgi:putative colanic acid biosynthesis UDP-glucose lipid carrier transferase
MSYLYIGEYYTKYFMVALVATIGYGFFAELFAIHRSWLAGTLKEMLFYVFIGMKIEK